MSREDNEAQILARLDAAMISVTAATMHLTAALSAVDDPTLLCQCRKRPAKHLGEQGRLE